MSRRGKHGDVRDLAGAFLGRIDPEGRRFGSRATAAWNEVVGPEIVRHTHGSALRDGELLVFVDSPVWANELSVMAEHLRERLNEALGEELVRSVRFAVSKRVAEERSARAAEEERREAYAPDEARSVPLTAQERAQVEYVASSISDEGLREAAIRAMTRHLEWKKAIGAENGREMRSEDL